MNEIVIDIYQKSKDDILKEAISLIDDFTPLVDYDYELDDENNYQSWIKSKNLK